MKFYTTMFIVLFAVSMWSSTAVKAQDFRKIDGDYTIAKPDGGNQLEFGLIITGEAAKKLYGALPVAASKDVCTGGTRKDHPTGMQCIKDGKDFTCSLGYQLKSGRTTSGPLTC